MILRKGDVLEVNPLDIVPPELEVDIRECLTGIGIRLDIDAKFPRKSVTVIVKGSRIRGIDVIGLEKEV